MIASPAPPQPPEPSSAILTRDHAIALALAALAGAVDTVGVVHWNGLFLSFMSGNSTDLGIAASSGNTAGLVTLATVIGSFVAGVILGELFGPRRRATVLVVEAGLLAAAAISLRHVEGHVAAAMISVAMGVQNASIHRVGGIGIALTYVTGTLVHLGRAVAQALKGAGAWSALVPYAGLWASLVSGAVLGAVAARQSQVGVLLAAAMTAAALAALTRSTDRRAQDSAGAGTTESPAAP